MTEIRGAEELRRCAKQLRAEQRALQGNVDRAARKAVKPLERAIREAIPGRVPNRYAGVLEGALKVFTSFRLGDIRVRIYGRGRKSQRDVDAINRGLLRHMLYGNPAHWYSQRVRAGFVTDPIRATAEDVYRGLDQVAEDVRQRIERG